MCARAYTHTHMHTHTCTLVSVFIHINDYWSEVQSPAYSTLYLSQDLTELSSARCLKRLVFYHLLDIKEYWQAVNFAPHHLCPPKEAIHIISHKNDLRYLKINSTMVMSTGSIFRIWLYHLLCYFGQHTFPFSVSIAYKMKIVMKPTPLVVVRIE